MKNNGLLLKGLNLLNIEPSGKMIHQFEMYFNLLIEWNKKINLTSITEENEVIVKHFLDSILVVKSINFIKVESMIDIGTGAGFPGIPLKILFPHLRLSLLDATNKKVNFLKEVCEELQLDKVDCIHGRAEDFANDSLYREQFDLAVSRAVSNLSTLSEYSLPYVMKGGFFISYKAEDCDFEIEDAKYAIQTLGGKIIKTEQFNIPTTDIVRTYVCIEKINRTPSIYPRKSGLPSKSPL